ncbi:penicillin-binding protein 2 [Patescibacteria group bacterium]
MDNNNNLKLDTKYRDLCIDTVEFSNEEELSEDIIEEFNEDSEELSNYKKINFLFVLFLFGICILISRIAYLQITKGDYYYSIAEGNRIRIQSIKPRRGIIYDRNYKPLVSNVPSFSLKIIQADLPKDEYDRENAIKEVSELIGKDVTEIKELLADKSAYYYQPIVIQENIDYDQAILLYVKSLNMQGVILEEVSKRSYVTDDKLNSLSHILGYNGKISEKELSFYEDKKYFLDDYIGKTGVELSFEHFLRGVPGKSNVETNALGKKIRIIAHKDSVAGNGLVLSIDYELQNYIETLLVEELKKIKKEKASVIVMDPRNGEIISMVSLPSYNNNLFIQGISNEDYQNLITDKNNPLFNRSISGAYPPGSTFKPVIASIALEQEIITEWTKINSVGGIWVSKWFFPDWNSAGHGPVNVKQAIANSVNTFFYYIGGGYNNFKGLGIDKLIENSKLFNIGKKTGIDLPSENSGFIPDSLWKEEKLNEQWYIGDTYHLSIGQGYLSVTPLQVTLWTSFFANNGIMYKPKILKSLIYPDDKEKIIKEEYLVKDIISAKNVKIIKDGMRDAVIYGSARSLSSLPFSSGGKTGTAQTSNIKDPHSWFTCFAPYENPEVVVVVLVEEGGEGSAVAVPIAKKILEYWGGREKILNIKYKKIVGAVHELPNL